MPTSYRTYSFRAPDDLGRRIKAASELLNGVMRDSHEEIESWLGREFHLGLLRHFAETRDPLPDQSSFMRSAVELLAAATEKVAADLELARDYAEWASKDAEGDAFRQAALVAAKSVWSDE